MEFNDLDLEKDIDAMSDDELRETLSEFMQAHQENRGAYDKARSRVDEVKTEYEEKLEEQEELIAEFTERRAQKAAEYVKMPADLLADRFDYRELDQIVEEGREAEADETEFSEDDDAGEENDDENLTTFSDSGEKGRREGGRGSSKYRSRAKARLQSQGFPVSDN